MSFFFLIGIISFAANIGQQIMKKLLMKKYRSSTCKKKTKAIRVESTPKVRDNLVYCFSDQEYSLYQVNNISEDEEGLKVYQCREFNIRGKIFTEEPFLKFGLVGVFSNYGLTTKERIMRDIEICGKVVAFEKFLITIPNNMLLET
jgi:hypothetical protein